MHRWYVLRSKPNKETLLHQQLQAYGMEAYLPQVRVNPVNPRARRQRPYFTGYLFVKLDLQAAGFSLLNWMPHSLGLVNFGGDPACVPEELIGAIRRQAAEFDIRKPDPIVKHGDLVSIERGPFAGYRAIFDTAISGDERARVLLLLLHNRQLSIDLPVNYLSLQHA